MFNIKMKTLTRKEIVKGLKEIGITNSSELGNCLKEYEDYLNPQSDKSGLVDNETSRDE